MARRSHAGWHFDFKFSEDISTEALEADRPKTPGQHPVHDLREIGFRKLCALQADDEESEEDGDDVFSLRESEAHLLLDGDAQGRFQPLWLEIAPDEQRDSVLAEAFEDEEIMDLWKDLVLLESGRSSRPRPAKRKRNGGSAASAARREPRRTALQMGLCLLCKSFRFFFCKKWGLYSGKNAKWDWGSYYEPDRYPFEVVSSRHRIKATIPFFSGCATPATEQADWSDINAFMTVSSFVSDDLGPVSTNEVFELASKVVELKPFCTRSHHVTVCKDRIRLWQFTPTTYATTRAYRFDRPADRLAIGRIIALLVASDQDSILRQWTPPEIMDIQVPGSSAGDAASSSTEQWQWVEGSPEVVQACGELWSARTAIFAGKARYVLAPGSQPALEQRHLRLDLGGQGERLTMVKCTVASKYFLEHEFRMQEHVTHLSRSPKPIGVMCVDIGPVEAHTKGADASHELHPHALVYQHLWGSTIPEDMPAKEVCKIFGELTYELQQYAQRSLHYRTLNVSNVLYTRESKPNAEPQLLITNHWNARLEGRHRGSKAPGPQGSNSNDQQTSASALALAREDAHMGDPKFQPSSVAHLKEAIAGFEAARSFERRRKKGRKGSRKVVVQGPDDALTQERRNLLLYSHSHLDDLESACYVHVWCAVRRIYRKCAGPPEGLVQRLHDAEVKRSLWEKPHMWWAFLFDFCSDMGDDWLELMRALNLTIRAAQMKRREELSGDADLLNKSLEELYTFTDTEIDCFETCREIFNRYHRGEEPLARAGARRASAAKCMLIPTLRKTTGAGAN